MFGLKATFKDHIVQPACQGKGHTYA